MVAGWYGQVKAGDESSCRPCLLSAVILSPVQFLAETGLTDAFPVGIGLALVVGAVSTYIISPKGNPLLLVGGIALVGAAIVFDPIAYRLRETERAAMSRRGVIIGLIAVPLMGAFYPFVSKAMAGEGVPDPILLCCSPPSM